MSKPTETTNDRVPRDLVHFGKHTDCRETHRLSGSVGVWFGEASGSVGGLGVSWGGPKRAGGLGVRWGGPKRAETRNGEFMSS